jgi:ABC-type branched-subunit amino acid transport system substrate-binding protein
MRRKLEFHLTPLHGSWVNMAEIELAVLARSCLNRRVPDVHTMGREVGAWEARRNRQQALVERHAYKSGGFDAARLVRNLRQDGAGVLFFAGDGVDVGAFLKEATAAGWMPHVLLLGTLVGRDLLDAVPQGLSDKLFLAFPTVPEDVTPGGMSEFRALQGKYKFAPRHVSSQLLAFAAAKVFVEALKRAGQDLTREKLIAALEGLYDFETGVTPRLTFGPNRRVGSTGAHIVGIDAGKKQFVNAGGWVNANR